MPICLIYTIQAGEIRAIEIPHDICLILKLNFLFSILHFFFLEHL